jgi:hypothetical protein
MNTKIILAIAAIALVAAALVGVTAAEFATNQTTNQPANSQALPPCAIANGEPYCNNNTYTGYCQGGQTYYGYAAQEQNQNQYQEQYRYGCGGMMSRSGYGNGCCR